MIAGYEWFSPTRTMGLLSYAVSFGACAWRWVAGRRLGRPDGVYLLLTTLQFGFLLDMTLDIRWKLHEFFMTRAMEHNVYGERRDPQLVALLLLVGILLIGAAWVVRRFRGRPGLVLAVSGTMLSIGLWFCEMLSYHFVDHVIYSMVGELMVVSLLWLGLAAMTCSGIWMDWRRRPSLNWKGAARRL